MNKKFLSWFLSGMMLMVLVLPSIGIAQGGEIENGAGGSIKSDTKISIVIKNPFKADNINELIEVLIDDILIPVGGVIAVLMIMWAGFLYVTARGKPDKIKTANQALLWAVVGAGILLGAWVISGAIGATIKQLQ